MRTLSTETIERVLSLLTAIETPGFEFAGWTDPSTGKVLDYPQYAPIVMDTLIALSQSSAGFDPYAELPEDSERDREALSTRTFTSPTVENATGDQIRRYLLLLLHGERFCDGFILAQYRSGTLATALRRFRDLSLASD